MTMGLDGQTGAPPGPEPRLLMHCRPPVSVFSNPVIAVFGVDLGPSGKFTASFERDSAGNSRVQLRQIDGTAPLFGQVWAMKTKSESLVFYQEGVVVARKWPNTADWGAWGFGDFESEWTDQHQKLAGYDVRKVALRTRAGKTRPAQDAGECWVSEPLATVMWERILVPGEGVKEWKVKTIDKKAPAADLLAIPAEFQILGATQHE